MVLLYVISYRSASAALRSQHELDGILRRLISSGYVPIMRTGAHAILKSCGAQGAIISNQCTMILSHMFAVSDSTPSYSIIQVLGDIFTHNHNIIAIQPAGARLGICEIRDHESPSHLSEFCDFVATAAKSTIDGRRLRGMDFEWVEAPIPHGRRVIRRAGLVRPVKDLQTKNAVLSEEDARDAALIVDRERREFMLRLAQLGKARSVDAQVDIEASISSLLENELVRKEFLVLCRKDSRTLCTVETREELEGDSGQKFKCSVCGRSFSAELIEEIFALTARGRKMLTSSHWMTIWVTSILVECGIPLEQIKWGATAGEDEIDIVAEIQGQSIFFELKDREFGLGDTYPFTARVQRYGARAGVIISMDDIAEEADKFLSEQSRSLGRPIYTMSGDSEVRTLLPSILRERAKSSAIESIKRVFRVAGVDPSPIMTTWAEATKSRTSS